MKSISLLVLMLLVAGSSCRKTSVPEGTPKCIERKIEEIRKEDVRNPPAEVYSYTYRGKTVYFLPQRCCDIPSELYDEKCHFICSPDGGFTGHGDGACRDFFEQRTNEKLIWKDGRK